MDFFLIFFESEHLFTTIVYISPCCCCLRFCCCCLGGRFDGDRLHVSGRSREERQGRVTGTQEAHRCLYGWTQQVCLLLLLLFTSTFRRLGVDVLIPKTKEEFIEYVRDLPDRTVFTRGKQTNEVCCCRRRSPCCCYLYYLCCCLHRHCCCLL